MRIFYKEGISYTVEIIVQVCLKCSDQKYKITSTQCLLLHSKSTTTTQIRRVHYFACGFAITKYYVTRESQRVNIQLFAFSAFLLVHPKYKYLPFERDLSFLL